MISKKKGKRRLPIPYNKVYCFLLYQIAYGNNYAQKIYGNNIKKYGKKSKTGVIVRQLEVLRKEGFIDFKIVENKSKFPMQRRKEYFIKWPLLIEGFYFIQTELEDQFDGIEDDEDGEPYTGGHLATDIWLDSLVSKINKNKVINKEERNEEEYLKSFLNDIFKFLGKYSKAITLDQIFEIIPEIFMHVMNSLNMEDKLKIVEEIKKNEKFNSFFCLMFGYYSGNDLSSKYRSIKEGVDNILIKICR